MSSHTVNIKEKIRDIKQLIRTDLPSARKAAMRILDNVQKGSDDVQKSDVYHLMGLIEFYDDNSKESLKWYSKELKLRERLKDVKGASDILNNMGAIYFNQGKLDKARDHYQMALTHRESINDQKGIAAAYNNIGGVLLKCGMAAEAFSMHSQALKINRLLGDTERIGANLQNIGLTYLSHEDFDQALSHFEEALSIAREFKDKARAVQLMINIGSTLIRKNKTLDAKRYYEQCYEESKSINYPQGLLVSLNNLAYIAQQETDFKKSIQYYNDCIQIARATDHITEIPIALSGIGNAYIALKDYEQALQYLHEAIKLAKKTGIKDILAEIYTRLSETYENLGDYKKAFDHYKKYIAVRDEVITREKTRTINEIKTRYEVEKKEKEAQLLKEKNEAISVYAHKLEVSNNSLKQFAHVASHDLREPLRMVSSYMGLLERSMADQISPTQRQFIDFAVDGARRMDTLIHDLLRLAKVDADPKIERVSLSSVVDEVKKNLQVLLREKNASITSSDLPVIMADRTQVLQLFQNIISNGIKYNESPAPAITIHYEAQQHDSLISIADNGIGIPVEQRERAFELFQRVHTGQKYQGSGIGLAICRKIVDGIGGTITIEDNKGGGSIFRITIPTAIVR